MPYSRYFRLAFTAIFVLSMLFLLGKSSTWIMTAALAHPQGEERQLEDLIPKNVPISVKIKKEKETAFKDLNNENWAHDFELEVTNTGDKPIYYVSVSITLDVKDSSGRNFWAAVHWGSTELGDHRLHALENDVAIKPGESVVLKFHPAYLAAMDKMRRDEGRELPRKIKLELHYLTFGDGTGYTTNSGTLLPRKIPPLH